MFLDETEVSGRKMYKLVDPKKGVLKYEKEMLDRITKAAGSK